MFKNDTQRALTCIALLDSLDLGRLFTTNGPTPEAACLARRNGGPLSSGERVMLLVAMALWTSDGGPAFSDLLRLDDARLRLVGEVLCALAAGAGTLNGWLARRIG